MFCFESLKSNCGQLHSKCLMQEVQLMFSEQISAFLSWMNRLFKSNIWASSYIHNISNPANNILHHLHKQIFWQTFASTTSHAQTHTFYCLPLNETHAQSSYLIFKQICPHKLHQPACVNQIITASFRQTAILTHFHFGWTKKCKTEIGTLRPDLYNKSSFVLREELHLHSCI